MTTIATVGDLQSRYHLTAHCNDCNRAKELESVWLCDTFDSDFPIPKVASKIKCGKCGGKNVGITLAAVTTG